MRYRVNSFVALLYFSPQRGALLRSVKQYLAARPPTLPDGRFLRALFLSGRQSSSEVSYEFSYRRVSGPPSTQISP